MAAVACRPADAELDAWLRLLALPGVGPVRGRQLLERYGGPITVLGSGDRWVEEGLAALARKPGAEGWIRRASSTIRRSGVHVLPITGSAYPPRLLHLTHPPIVVFGQGDLGLLDRPVVAIVGTRAHTEYGGTVAADLARGLGRAGVVVASGLALGIDARAHAAALETGTLAVLGAGVDVVYPERNARLQRAMGRHGLLLSEFLPGTPPEKDHFPRRNRIIAALALGVVVVEAPHKSGALITARQATEMGRDIMAVPGRVDRPTSEGTNALLRDGARLVSAASDILEELRLPVPAQPAGSGGAPRGLDRLGRGVWTALAREPRAVDEIAARARAAAARVLPALLAMELDGLVEQLPGSRFRRADRA